MSLYQPQKTNNLEDYKQIDTSYTTQSQPFSISPPALQPGMLYFTANQYPGVSNATKSEDAMKDISTKDTMAKRSPQNQTQSMEILTNNPSQFQEASVLPESNYDNLSTPESYNASPQTMDPVETISPSIAGIYPESLRSTYIWNYGDYDPNDPFLDITSDSVLPLANTSQHTSPNATTNNKPSVMEKDAIPICQISSIKTSRKKYIVYFKIKCKFIFTPILSDNVTKSVYVYFYLLQHCGKGPRRNHHQIPDNSVHN